MNLRERLKQPGVMLRVGLVALILASMSRLYLRPVAGLSEGAVDGATGVLYGIAIGGMLMSLWLRRGRGTSGGGRG